MLWNKRTRVAVEPLEEELTDTPSPVSLPDEQVADDEYVLLAKKLKIPHTGEFEVFLRRHGLGVYSPESVRTYLNKQYKGMWGFRAIREQDNPGRRVGDFIARDGTINNGSKLWDKEENGRLIGGEDRALYAKTIPYPVLLTIESVERDFPTATFWVSDKIGPQKHIVKDPFLLVRVEGKNYIIERWDEPGYRA